MGGVKPPPCCLLMRNCSNPMQRIEWSTQGETKAIGGSLVGELQRQAKSSNPRDVSWQVIVTLSVKDGTNANTTLINGGVVALSGRGSIQLAAGDLLQYTGGAGADGSSDGLWRVEWGPSYYEAPSEAAQMPRVLSFSPYVVGEAAANVDIFELMRTKVGLLTAALGDVIAAAGASKAVTPWRAAATDPPQVALSHQLDWMREALHQLEGKLKVKPQTISRETQSSHGAGISASRMIGAGRGDAGMLPVASHDGDGDLTTSPSPQATLVASLEHQLWVSRQQLQSVMRDDVARTMELLLHRNAELERRLAERQNVMAAYEEELHVLRNAVAVDHGKRLVAVEQLERLLRSRQQLRSAATAQPPLQTSTPSLSSPPPAVQHSQALEPLTATQERQVWSSVSDLLQFVETADCMAEAAKLQMSIVARGGGVGGSGQHLLELNEQLRAELASLRAEGSVEVVATLQSTVRDLASRLGGVGRSSMSAWM